jgi:dipeptidyl aminopeptidase/acylaminoacyl peptidase
VHWQAPVALHFIEAGPALATTALRTSNAWPLPQTSSNLIILTGWLALTRRPPKPTARSPLRHLERFRAPTLFLHGTADPIVPLEQPLEIASRLHEQGTPVATLFFEGEQHDFRDIANLKRAMEAELAFFARVLDFQLGEAIDAVSIDNLPNAGRE